jgi:hypothetical protein
MSTAFDFSERFDRFACLRVNSLPQLITSLEGAEAILVSLITLL